MRHRTVRRWRVLVPAAIIVALGGCSGAPAPRNAPSPPAGKSGAHAVYNLAYASASPTERLDLYLPASGTGPAPVVVWVHGGGWRVGDKSSIKSYFNPSLAPPKPHACNDIVEVQVPDLATLNAKGYAVAAVNYRLAQDPIAAVRDAKAAVRFLRAGATRYGLDPDRFAVWGDSAGGYSAIMLGVTGARPTAFDDPALGNAAVPATVQAVVDWFGPTDSSSMPGNVGADASPYTYLTAGSAPPPFMIAHGDADCVVPVGQSRHLSRALTAAGGSATLAVLPGAGHEDPAFMRTQMAPTLAFLDRELRR
jgi:acetyl esterase/lipase